jgi:hypothetical protein
VTLVTVRAIAVWLILMVLAIANGVFRNSVVGRSRPQAA